MLLCYPFRCFASNLVIELLIYSFHVCPIVKGRSHVRSAPPPRLCRAVPVLLQSNVGHNHTVRRSPSGHGPCQGRRQRPGSSSAINSQFNFDERILVSSIIGTVSLFFSPES